MKQDIRHCTLALFTMLQTKSCNMNKPDPYVLSKLRLFSYSSLNIGVLPYSLAIYAMYLDREKGPN